MPRAPRLTLSPAGRTGRTSAADRPLPDRPRERLHRLGPGALSTGELLALLVGTGGTTGSAFEVAERLLGSAGGSLRRLDGAPRGAWRAIPGVGRATEARLRAAFELGRRAALEDHPARLRIRGPGDVAALMAPGLRDLRHEEFHAILLNAQHRVLRTVLVTRGILDASLIHPREVFQPAIVESAAAVILVHNHPSGDPTASAEDRAVTRELVAAGRALGIPVLDHVVVGGRRWISLAEEGELAKR